MSLLLGLALALVGDELAAGDVALVLGGDVALGRIDRGRRVAIGGEVGLKGVGAVLATADLTVVNLECVLWDGEVDATGVRLVAPTSAVAVLGDVGIDVVSVANNHALDAGREGVLRTDAALSELEIDAVGALERVVVREVRGVRIAFVALTDRRNATTAEADLGSYAYVASERFAEVAAARVTAAKVDAQVVVLLVHWGTELEPRPGKRERAVARAAIDAGARLVVGHGPHVLWPVERYKQAVVFYSLGNLLFDMDEPETRRGALARVMITHEGEIRGWEVIATIAGDDDAPRFGE